MGIGLDAKHLALVPARSLEVDEETVGSLLASPSFQVWLRLGHVSITDQPVAKIQTPEDYPPRRSNVRPTE